MEVRTTWRELHTNTDEQLATASELPKRGNTRAVERPESNVPTAKKKLAALLPSRRGTRGSPSLNIHSSDRFHTSPIDCGHFDLQSSAYELAEHSENPMSDHTVMKHLTENLSSKSQSRWTSIRPHLSSGVASAIRGWEGANINHEPGNVGLKSPPDRVILDAREIHNSRISSLGFQSSLESRESTDVNTNLHPILPNVIACSYLDATNEFSDIPVIEGSLSINDVSSASRMNEALLRWKDISDKVEVRVFSVKTLFRGFSDISVIPEVKSSFFDLRKFGELYPKRIISVTGNGVAMNSASGQAGVNTERSFCLIFSSDQRCLDTLEMMTSMTFTTWFDALDLSKKYSKVPSISTRVKGHENEKYLQKFPKTELQHEEQSNVTEPVVFRTRRAVTVSADPTAHGTFQGINTEHAKMHHPGISDSTQLKSQSTAQSTFVERPPNGIIWFFRVVKHFYQQAMTSPKKIIFSLSNSHLWICIVLGCSVYSLLARDIWIVADGPIGGDPVVYGLLVVCFVVFCLQVFANFVVDVKHYQFSYKFWVDILVILTTIFDVFFAGRTEYDLGCAAIALRANQCFVYFLKALQFAEIHVSTENDNVFIQSLVDLQNSRIMADTFLQQRFPSGCSEENLPYLEVLEVLEEKHMTLSQKILKIFNRRLTITALVLIFIFQFQEVFITVPDYPNVFQLSSILLLTDLTPNRNLQESPAAIVIGNTLELYPRTLNLCIEGVCPIGSNDPKPKNVRPDDIRLSELGESKNYLWIVKDNQTDYTKSVFNLITLLGIPIMVFWANTAFNRDIDRLVKNPLQELADRIKMFAADPFVKLDEIERQNEAKVIKEETYYVQRQYCNLLKALQSSVGPVGNFFLSQNLTNNDVNDDTQHAQARFICFYIVMLIFLVFIGYTRKEDIFIYINRIAGYLHGFVASSSGCCFRNSGDQFACAWRVADKSDDTKALSGKEGDTKRKKEAKTSNSFDKALASMIKTLNACHFDQALKEQSLYCEPLMNQMPNFLLKLCFGFHYGSAIEGIIGSNFRFEACFASLNSDFQATLQRGCTYYQVGSLFSDKFVQSLSSITRNSFRLIDFVRVPGSREPFGIYTYDWVPKNPLEYAHVKSIKQFFDLNPSKYSIDDLSEYRKAVDAYVEGHWTSAIVQFKSLLQRQFADDGPCKVIIEFMEMFGSTAPDDWKGCSEIAMLDSIANIRDIYNLPY